MNCNVNKEDLKAARKRLNLTQEQMANFLNTSFRTYQGWESRYKTPSSALVAIEMLEQMNEKNRHFWVNKDREY